MKRVSILAFGVVLNLLAAVGPACAQVFPAKPVQIVVPFSPGGPSDIFARLLGTRLGEAWKQPVIVDNKPGATGLIGASFVAHAPADGQALVMASTSSHIAPALYARPVVNTGKELRAVVNVVEMPLYLVVNPSLNVRTLPELVSLVKASPGKYSYASAGNGATNHLATELLKQTAGLDIVHVPYKGAAPALQAVISGEVAMTFDTVSQAEPFVAAGRLVAIATSGKLRDPATPGVPTVAEQGYPAFTPTLWFGLFAPARTPDAAVDRINADVTRAMAAPELQARLKALGGSFVPAGAKAFQARADADTVLWKGVIARTGTTAD